ncbi:LysR family transcriptional regulator [Burkholderia sp. ABCPW 14]|uniref:LysR family transcriptional regulator n=1 Tax=Burkholderia sp. ABCPW 14 TaxID=1637860 RepID=UPI001E440CFF|nr:LysR family transcriptional regulator [Burkholderia sp. ABCPW 14]
MTHLQAMVAFVHAVGAGSFTAAACRVGLSKSAVGKNVARLEQRLGVRLLERTTRALTLTTEGRLYYESCLRILDQLVHVEAVLAQRRHEVAGPLRVSLSTSFGRRWVLPVLIDLAERHPLLQLDVSFTDRFVDLIDEGVDVVVRLGELRDSANTARRPLGIQRSVLCASPAYLAVRGRPATIDELTGHDCIVFARDGRAIPWVFSDVRNAAVTADIRAKHSIGQGDALRDAVLSGNGLAYLPTWLVADDLRAGRLDIVLPDFTGGCMPIHVLWPVARGPSPKVQAVVEELTDYFTPTPPWDRLGQAETTDVELPV